MPISPDARVVRSSGGLRFNLIASLVIGMIDQAIFGQEILGFIFALGVLLPGVAVAARQLRDIDRSGWWLLIALIPLIGWIVLIYWYISEGTPGANQFGGQGLRRRRVCHRPCG